MFFFFIYKSFNLPVLNKKVFNYIYFKNKFIPNVYTKLYYNSLLVLKFNLICEIFFNLIRNKNNIYNKNLNFFFIFFFFVFILKNYYFSRSLSLISKLFSLSIFNLFFNSLKKNSLKKYHYKKHIDRNSFIGVTSFFFIKDYNFWLIFILRFFFINFFTITYQSFYLRLLKNFIFNDYKDYNFVFNYSKKTNKKKSSKPFFISFFNVNKLSDLNANYYINFLYLNINNQNSKNNRSVLSSSNFFIKKLINLFAKKKYDYRYILKFKGRISKRQRAGKVSLTTKIFNYNRFFFFNKNYVDSKNMFKPSLLRSTVSHVDYFFLPITLKYGSISMKFFLFY